MGIEGQLTGKSRSFMVYRVRMALTVTMTVLCAVLGFAVWGAQAARASAPPGLPGPPPDAGAGLPLPPAPGQAPPAEPDGPATTIPVTGSGPGLLSGTASFHGTRVSFPVACTASGRVTMSAATFGQLAQTRYRCANGRGVVSLSLAKDAARQIASDGSVLAHLAFVQGGTTEQQSLMVGPRVAAAATWTSYYGLGCTTLGSNQAQLLAPNFSDTPTTTIDVRPWLAWYTAATGWQWIGTAGADASTWYQWTATPSGVAEWLTPSGTTTPWTWAPISVTPGHDTFVIAVFEAVYWYSHPVYVWRYARSGAGATSITTYCEYP
jgi:hypothetical protein